MIHALKCWPEFFKDVEAGDKNFEVRKFDRPFKVGDKLLLQEYDPGKGEYTRNEITRIITYILSGDVNKFGLFADYCIMGLKEEDL